MSGSLPAGWTIAKLADIADITMGSSPPGYSYNTSGNGVPLVNGPVEFGAGPLDQTVIKQYTTEPVKLCKQGDLLLCVRGSTTGRTNIAGCDAAIGRGVAAIRALIIQPFLNYYLASQRDLIFALGTGSTFPNIQTATLLTLPIAVPPLAEQQRIVAKIEELVPDVVAGVSILERAETNIKHYRAAILRAAIDGSLTTEWRASHHISETGSQLLKRVLIERRRRWEVVQLAKYEVSEKTPPKNWQKKYIEPTPPDTSKLPKLPKGWCWTTVKQVGDIQLGRQRSPEHHIGEHMRPYLRVANVFEDRIDTSDVMKMNFTPEEFATFHLKYGDILLNEGQSLELVGRPAMYRDEVTGACFTNTLVRFRPYDGVTASYALRVFQAYQRNGRFQKIAKISTNIAHLGAERFAEIEFPLPPSEEQAAFVKELDQRFSLISAAQAVIEKNMMQAVRLRQGILRHAFEGKLVPQDPSDETASVLLDRIRQERVARPATEQAKGKGGKRKGAKRMTKQERQKLIDILKVHPKGLSPEDLLREAGYAITEVDDFYNELRAIAGQIDEERPSNAKINKWPKEARILLRVKVK